MQSKKTRTTVRKPVKSSPRAKPLAAGWKTKSPAELIAEQGVKPVESLKDLMGQGHDLWRTDEEFEQFLQWLRDSRRAGR